MLEIGTHDLPLSGVDCIPNRKNYGSFLCLITADEPQVILGKGQDPGRHLPGGNPAWDVVSSWDSSVLRREDSHPPVPCLPLCLLPPDLGTDAHTVLLGRKQRSCWNVEGCRRLEVHGLVPSKEDRDSPRRFGGQSLPACLLWVAAGSPQHCQTTYVLFGNSKVLGYRALSSDTIHSS